MSRRPYLLLDPCMWSVMLSELEFGKLIRALFADYESARKWDAFCEGRHAWLSDTMGSNPYTDDDTKEAWVNGILAGQGATAESVVDELRAVLTTIIEEWCKVRSELEKMGLALEGVEAAVETAIDILSDEDDDEAELQPEAQA